MELLTQHAKDFIKSIHKLEASALIFNRDPAHTLSLSLGGSIVAGRVKDDG